MGNFLGKEDEWNKNEFRTFVDERDLKKYLKILRCYILMKKNLTNKRQKERWSFGMYMKLLPKRLKIKRKRDLLE